MKFIEGVEAKIIVEFESFQSIRKVLDALAEVVIRHELLLFGHVDANEFIVS